MTLLFLHYCLQGNNILACLLFFSDVLGRFSITYVVAESFSVPLDPDKNDNASPTVEQLWKFLFLHEMKKLEIPVFHA